MSIFVTVQYPNKEGSRFDMDYYINNHLPLVAEKFGEAMLSLKACKGIATPNPEVTPVYQVMTDKFYQWLPVLRGFTILSQTSFPYCFYFFNY